MQSDAISGLVRRMPPAVFPSIMGLTGLALAWRAAGVALGIGQFAHLVVFAAAIGIYTLMFVLYAAKFMRRMNVFMGDMRTFPGRMGLATMTLTLMLFAIGLTPYTPYVARAILFAGLIGHICIAIGAVVFLIQASREDRRVTPVWHLTFVGFIVGALAAAPLGYDRLSLVLFAVTFVLSLLIYGATLEQSKTTTIPPPMRPTLMIHLAPLSLFGSTALVLGLPGTAVTFAVIASCLFFSLLIRVRWITEAGFTPFWASFPFPVAAYSALLLSLADQFAPFLWVGVTVLVAATLLIPFILFRVQVLFWTGKLAAATKPAEA